MPSISLGTSDSERKPWAMVEPKRGELGFFRVNVDELVIAGALGKLVDALLIDGQPFGTAEFFADVAGQFGGGY